MLVEGQGAEASSLRADSPAAHRYSSIRYREERSRHNKESTRQRYSSRCNADASPCRRYPTIRRILALIRYIFLDISPPPAFVRRVFPLLRLIQPTFRDEYGTLCDKEQSTRNVSRPPCRMNRVTRRELDGTSRKESHRRREIASRVSDDARTASEEGRGCRKEFLPCGREGYSGAWEVRYHRR